MSTVYSFEILFNIAPGSTARAVGGGLSEKALNILYAPGCCDDAAFGACDGVDYAWFDREAASAGAAVSSAFMDLRLVKGIEIIDFKFTEDE